MCLLFRIFFFKQKTAYEMRISDWSSDVCSSDLFIAVALGSTAELQTQLLLSRDLGLGASAPIDEALAMCDRVGRMLQRLHQALRRKIGRASGRERVWQYG